MGITRNYGALLAKCFGGTKALWLEMIELRKQDLRNKYFSPELLPNIFSSLCIISHIAKNIGNSNSIFFFSGGGSGNQNTRLLELKNPVVTFLGKSFALPLNWDTNKRYETGDYFINANPLAGLNSFPDNKEKIEASTYLHILDEVTPVIDYAIHSGMFPNLL